MKILTIFLVLAVSACSKTIAVPSKETHTHDIHVVCEKLKEPCLVCIDGICVPPKGYKYE